MRPIATFLFVVGALVSAPLVAQVGNNTDVLNPNLAEEKELGALPHMTPEMVSLITGGRPFLGVLTFDAELSGTLSDAQRTELYELLFLPVNLNTASETEIMLIPGMSGRMAHEFEEYRPYKSMDQFRREIGKYVDVDEVARFERYVTLD